MIAAGHHAVLPTFTWDAFFLSPAFAGVCAVFVGLVTAVVALLRLWSEHRKELRSDERGRWWDTLEWVWDHRFEMDDDTLVDSLAALEGQVDTEAQSLFLRLAAGMMLEG